MWVGELRPGRSSWGHRGSHCLRCTPKVQRGCHECKQLQGRHRSRRGCCRGKSSGTAGCCPTLPSWGWGGSQGTGLDPKKIWAKTWSRGDSDWGWRCAWAVFPAPASLRSHRDVGHIRFTGCLNRSQAGYAARQQGPTGYTVRAVLMAARSAGERGVLALGSATVAWSSACHHPVHTATMQGSTHTNHACELSNHAAIIPAHAQRQSNPCMARASRQLP
ncbi:hypothetical protein V8C86DRAFT_229776 [Haematococcus lacustris]